MLRLIIENDEYRKKGTKDQHNYYTVTSNSNPLPAATVSYNAHDTNGGYEEIKCKNTI